MILEYPHTSLTVVYVYFTGSLVSMHI